MFRFFVSLVLLFAATTLSAQDHGKVMESVKFQSAALNQSTEITIYLPPDYQSSERNYPVVYLLHGYSDDETAWLQNGEVARIADEGIKNGTIPPMIIVMPDGKINWYINNYNNTQKYEDYLISELVPYIDKNYRTRPSYKFRALAGLSMGGYGSLYHLLKHPDMFIACAALSAAVITDQQASYWFQNPGLNFIETYGEYKNNNLPKTWKENNILTMAENVNKESMNNHFIWLDCGDDDFLIEGNFYLAMLLRNRGINFEFRMRDGAHTWTYWREGIGPGLEYLGKAFKRL